MGIRKLTVNHAMASIVIIGSRNFSWIMKWGISVATGSKRGNLPPPTASDRAPSEIDPDPRKFWGPEKMGLGLELWTWGLTFLTTKIYKLRFDYKFVFEGLMGRCIVPEKPRMYLIKTLFNLCIWWIYGLSFPLLTRMLWEGESLPFTFETGHVLSKYAVMFFSKF